MDAVLKHATDILSDRFDEFVAACMDENGKPKAPSMQALMKARGYLPARCPTAFQPKVRKESTGG